MINPHLPTIQALEPVMHERFRQIEDEGYSVEHDDKHDRGEIAQAASVYLMPAGMREQYEDDEHPTYWPWSAESWKPTPDDRERELIKGLALGLAELERIQRAKKA